MRPDRRHGAPATGPASGCRGLDGARTAPGSTVIIATFALDGPERCSGLPVQCYSAETLAQRLGPGFRLADQVTERHTTPGGAAQAFSYAVLARR